ncbi:MAG: dihydrofolate reductase [Alphaproteobacteria bacterium]|nr:dihydrofolate reductase [Alphaproteobacteria bacterium]
MGLSLVVAVGRRNEIGYKGGLLFRLKADMAHFRAVTAGKPVVMGRKTWDSLPRRPLAGRANIVVSRQTDVPAPHALVYSSVAAAISVGKAIAAKVGKEEIGVIGGAALYAACLPAADRLWLTEVDAEAEADVFFPLFDRREWREASAVRFEADDANEHAFVIRELVRKS